MASVDERQNQRWITEHQHFLSNQKLYIARTLDRFRRAGAFSGIAALPLKTRTLVEQKLTELVAHPLFRLENYALMERWRARRDAWEHAAEGERKVAALTGDREAARRFAIYRWQADETSALLKKNGEILAQVDARRGKRSRPDMRNSDYLDRIVIDSALGLRHAAGASWYSIWKKSLPRLLEAVQTEYRDILPARGLADPKGRYRVRVREALRVELMPGCSSRSDLEDFQICTLFSWDERFRDSRRRRRAAQRTKVKVLPKN